jgi:hypothetical protein
MFGDWWILLWKVREDKRMKSGPLVDGFLKTHRILESNLFLLIFLLLITVVPLCISPESIANRDIIVEKVSAVGMEEWQVKVDSGYDDYSHSITESLEGGYVVGGTYMYNDARGRCATDKPCKYAYKYPRIIWLKHDGIVTSDIIYASERLDGEPVSFFPTGREEYIIGSYWSIMKLGEGNKIIFKKTFEYKNYGSIDVFSIIETSDGNYTFVGDRAPHNEIPSPAWIASINQDGDLIWEHLFPNTSWFRKVADIGDGSYLIVDDENRLYSMDSPGHLVWNQTGLGEILAMRPSSGGYQILVPGRSYDLNREGNITRSVTFKPIDPVIWTNDGGFAGVSIEGENISVTRFDQEGKVVWQQGNPNRYRAKPVSLIETKDGGFAILLTVDNGTPS